MNSASTFKSCVLNLKEIGPTHCLRVAAHEARLIYEEIFENREYASEVLKWWPGMTIVDVGANIGLFARFAFEQCQHNCRILCFEPVPVTHAMLAKNLQQWGMDANQTARAINLGLTHIDGPTSLEFTFYPRAPGNSTFNKTEKDVLIASLEKSVTDPNGTAVCGAWSYDDSLPWQQSGGTSAITKCSQIRKVKDNLSVPAKTVST